MSQPLFRLTAQTLTFPYSDMYLPQFLLNADQIYVPNGPMTLTDPTPAQGPFASPDIMNGNTNIRMGSPVGPVDQSVTNNAWLVIENDSSLQTTNITGNGYITVQGQSELNSTSATGTGSANEIIGLVNNSNLYLGMQPGLQFLSPIEMDNTSTIHLTDNPANWATIFTSMGGPGGLGAIQGDMLGWGSLKVDSLTPGYAPQLVLQFGGANGQIVGATIKDVLIPGHTS